MNKHTFALQLGARIRERRKFLKMTQADLAGSDFTKSFISQIEKGQTSPAVWSLVMIAQRLDCAVGYLIGETDSAPLPSLAHVAHKVGIDLDTATRFLELVLREAKGDSPTAHSANTSTNPRPS